MMPKLPISRLLGLNAHHLPAKALDLPTSNFPRFEDYHICLIRCTPSRDLKSWDRNDIKSSPAQRVTHYFAIHKDLVAAKANRGTGVGGGTEYCGGEDGAVSE